MKNSIQSIIRIWNSFFNLDPTTSAELKRKFFNSQFITPIEIIRYRSAFSLAGYRIKKFYYDNDLESSWILGSGFKDSDDFIHLINEQLNELDKRGKEIIYFSNFVPDYFFPGVDQVTYPLLYNSLIDAGFKEKATVISMARDLWNWLYMEEKIDGIDISYIKRGEGNKLLDFISNNFSSDWYYRAETVLKYGQSDQIVVARKYDNIVGYGMYSAGEGKSWFLPGERFGPFGVAENYRSLGIGQVILIKVLQSMKANGIKHAYFLWTDEKASHLYARNGFKEVRRFKILSRII